MQRIKTALLVVIVLILAAVPTIAQEITPESEVECVQHGGLVVRDNQNGGDNALLDSSGEIVFDLGEAAVFQHISSWAVNSDGVVYAIAEDTLRGELWDHVFIAEDITYQGLADYDYVRVTAVDDLFILELENSDFYTVAVDQEAHAIYYKSVSGDELASLLASVVCD